MQMYPATMYKTNTAFVKLPLSGFQQKNFQHIQTGIFDVVLSSSVGDSTAKNSCYWSAYEQYPANIMEQGNKQVYPCKAE